MLYIERGGKTEGRQETGNNSWGKGENEYNQNPGKVMGTLSKTEK